MASTSEMKEAEKPWLEAKRIIHAMQKMLSQMDKDDASNKKLADLDAVEHQLELLRLACMATTFTDFQYAHENRVLDKLWRVHTLIHAEYKKTLQRYRGHGHVVQFRTVEKQYAKHLKMAQYFYKGFIERLSALYRLRPLQRIAHQLMLPDSVHKLEHVIDACAANVALEVTSACYRTVLHLGDLARYRIHHPRNKGLGPDMALSYYGLAQALMPHEGDAHHQMAVMLADQRKDFDVVYHFLRAWSVEHPSPLASKNLTSEFKKLVHGGGGGGGGGRSGGRSGSRGRSGENDNRNERNERNEQNGNGHGNGGERNGDRHGRNRHPQPSSFAPPDPYDTFGNWFLRLHAYYFRGDEFSQQTELEREVLHRWEGLLKASERPDYLLKVVLMNMAAYDIAQRQVQAAWSATRSQSCQFLLHFHVRTILVLGRVLAAETERLLEAGAERPEPGGRLERAGPENAVSDKAPDRASDKASDKAGSDKPGAPEKPGRNNGGGGGGGRRDKKQAASHLPPPPILPKAKPSDTCLALFRIYVAWMQLHRGDLVQYKDFLAPHLDSMHRIVTRCLTLFVGIIAGTAASPASYLLPEDVEVVGLAPLDGWAALRLGGGSELGGEGSGKERVEEAGGRLTRTAGGNIASKPRYDDQDVERFSPEQENLARIYDVVECTIMLVHDDAFPWIASTVREGDAEVTKICYTDDFSPSMAPAAAAIFPVVPVTPVLPTGTSPEPIRATSRAAGSSEVSGPGLAASVPPAEPTIPAVTVVAAVPAEAASSQDQTATKSPGVISLRPGPGEEQPPLSRTSLQPFRSLWQPRCGDMTAASASTVSTGPAFSSVLDPATASVPAPAPAPTSASLDIDYSVTPVDDELERLDPEGYSRVRNFLAPPESHHSPRLPTAMTPTQSLRPSLSGLSGLPPPPALTSSSSYGMHTATAESIFGRLQFPGNARAATEVATTPTAVTPATAAATLAVTPSAPSLPVGTSSRPFPSFPWDLDYTPTPNRSAGGSSYSSLAQPQVQAQAQAHKLQQQSPVAHEDKMAYFGLASGQMPLSSGVCSLLGSSLHGGPLNASSSNGGGFPTALSPVGAAAVKSTHAASLFSNSSPWGLQPGQGLGTIRSQSRGDMRLLPQQLQQAQAASLGLGGFGGFDGFGGFGGSGSGNTGGNGGYRGGLANQVSPLPSSLYASHFGMNASLSSSLPPVQSPRGLPGAAVAAMGRVASMSPSPISGYAASPLQSAYESIYLRQSSSPVHASSSMSPAVAAAPAVTAALPTSKLEFHGGFGFGVGVNPSDYVQRAKWAEAASAWERDASGHNQGAKEPKGGERTGTTR